MTCRTRRWATFFFALSLVDISCGEETTRGRRVLLQTQVAGPIDLAAAFVTSMGWQVTLSQAWVATGPLYYFCGEPLVARAAKRTPFAVAVFFSAKRAWAHPGHGSPGQALGQMLQPFSADLFAGSVQLPVGQAVTGQIRSAAFSFAPPTAGPAVSGLAGHAAFVVGVAQKSDRRVHFSATARFEDIAARSANAVVSGCVVQSGDVQGPGTMNVTIDPRVWLQLVDFSEMPDGHVEAPAPLPQGSTAHIGFLVGLLQTRAYTFTFFPDLNTSY